MSAARQSLKLLSDALASYDQAISLRPNFAEAFNNRGDVLREMGRIEEARASYDRALALRPDFAEAKAGAALCLSPA